MIDFKFSFQHSFRESLAVGGRGFRPNLFLGVDMNKRLELGSCPDALSVLCGWLLSSP